MMSLGGPLQGLQISLFPLHGVTLKDSAALEPWFTAVGEELGHYLGILAGPTVTVRHA